MNYLCNYKDNTANFDARILQLDFFSLDTTEEINEYLSLSISTDNPSEKMKVIYIVIIVILCFFAFLVIALVILYYYLIDHQFDIYF